jgi:hypothetical protein
MTANAPESAPPADLDYHALQALFINCTLTRSPGASHTARLMGGVAAVMRHRA